MDNKEIEFISPKDMKKGDIFTFEEVFSLDENITRFEKATSELVDDKASKEVEAKLKGERKLLEKEKELLAQEFENRINRMQDEAQSKIDAEIKIARADAKQDAQEEINQLKVKAELSDNFKEQVKDLRNDLDKVKEAYNEVLEQKLEDLRSKHELAIEEKIKEIEEAKLSNKAIGDAGEDYVREQLSDAWNDDNVIKPNAAKGEADVLHQIKYNGEVIASIYYEVKNRKSWARSDYDNFVEKVRNEEHEFNIYIANALPKSSREQHIKYFNEDFMYDEINNIYMLKFSNWLPVIAALRNHAIKLNEIQGTKDRVVDIKDKVYDFFKSPDFANYYSRTTNNILEVKKHFKSIKDTADKGISEAMKAEEEIKALNREIEIKLK